jgi:hypothetical protein
MLKIDRVSGLDQHVAIRHDPQMDYFPLDSFIISNAQDLDGLGYARSIVDGSLSLVIGTSAGRHVIQIEKWRAWDIKEMATPELIIPECRVEVDLSSAFDAESNYSALGTVIVSDGAASLYVNQFQATYNRPARIDLGISITAAHKSVGFSRWTIVCGSGQEVRVLHTVDVGRTERPVY